MYWRNWSTSFLSRQIYTSMYAPDHMPDRYRRLPIHTSFMQRLPGIADNHQRYLPIYPRAFERMDLSDYDLVVSNKSGFCHGVRTQNGGQKAIHVCYCLTPTRFLWLYEQYREREQIGGLVNAGLQPVLSMLRRWDLAAAQRVDHFVAISHEVQKRIQEIYGRESVVIYPPVDTAAFMPDPERQVGDYFLIVSRLIPYKRLDLAIEAFRRLPQEQLIIVGDGRDRALLEASAPQNVTFLGRQPQTLELLRGCKAFIFPGLEDFGIAPVEAMAAGRPVIAFAGGGALDTVKSGVSGELFDEQTPESLRAVLAQFDADHYDPAACRAQAEQFSVENFRNRLCGYLEQVIDGQL